MKPPDCCLAEITRIGLIEKKNLRFEFLLLCSIIFYLGVDFWALDLTKTNQFKMKPSEGCSMCNKIIQYYNKEYGVSEEFDEEDLDCISRE